MTQAPTGRDASGATSAVRHRTLDDSPRRLATSRWPGWSIVLGALAALGAFWLGRASTVNRSNRSMDLAGASAALQQSATASHSAAAGFTVITVLDAEVDGALLQQTHRSLEAQTAPWRWHVWTDGVEAHWARLAGDDRVELLRGPPASGACGLRNAALAHARADPSIGLIAFAEPGDAFEPTAFEKSVWMLDSVKNWAFVSSCACPQLPRPR